MTGSLRRSGRFASSVLLFSVAVGFTFILACRSNETALTKDGKVRLTVWGLPETDRFAGFFEAVREFERRHPDIVVVMGTPGGQTNADPQKLMTAIAGGAAPDLMWQDRFTIGGWASRDAFEPLDDFAREDGVTSATFYPSCWEEATYQGHLYALPWDTDSRALYYNRHMLDDAKIDAAAAFSDWNKLLDASDKLTKRDAKGDYQSIGFFPLMGNNWLYLYGWLNGGEFMSADRTRVTLDDPRIIAALQWMVDAYKRVGGYEEMNSFMSSAQIEGMGDPFLAGRLGMKIDGNWVLDSIARYKPDFDFGVVPPPPPPGRASLTWSGGFAWAIPRGAPHARESWELAKWLCSMEAWRIANDYQMELNARSGAAITIPMLSASREVNKMSLERYPLSKPNLAQAFQTFVGLLEVSRTRPVTPVGQELWNEHARAIDQALLGLATPEVALREATKRVQFQLDAILSPPDHPTFNLGRAVFAVTAAILVGVAFFVCLRISRLRKRGQLTRMARQELTAGLLFISPWLVGFLLFFLVPMVTSLILVFANYDVLHSPRFVGGENFQNLLGFHRTEQGRL
ncbi:MAG: extracellular solute-binding protein, partial [bacterium]